MWSFLSFLFVIDFENPAPVEKILERKKLVLVERSNARNLFIINSEWSFLCCEPQLTPRIRDDSKSTLWS